MNIINPFDKEGKEGMDFIDRTAIAGLFIIFAGLTIFIIVKIAGLFKKPK